MLRKVASATARVMTTSVRCRSKDTTLGRCDRSPVFAGGNTVHPFERAVERGVGIVAHRICDFQQLAAAITQQPRGLVHAPASQVFERGLADELLESHGESGARHAPFRR